MRVARVVNIYKSVFRGGNGWMCERHSVKLMYIYTQHTIKYKRMHSRLLARLPSFTEF